MNIRRAVPVLVIFLFCWIPMAISQIEMEKKDVDTIRNPTPPNETSQDRGRELFMSRCVVCHGMEGRGDGPHSESLGVPPWDFTQDITDVTDGDLFNGIKNGGQFLWMPPFGLILMDDQIWDVINYLRLLEKGGN